nr:GTP 3',8-cyclase MoaA [uncultured Cohaesibacter sp.]
MAFCDTYGRKIEYVRLSITDKCNMRCTYCMPERHNSFISTSKYLSFAEIVRVIAAFADLGVSRVRLTGGEPLVRKGVDQLAHSLTDIPGIDDLSMSTNAVLLEDRAEAIFKAGVKRLNVSLDTLNPDRYRALTRGGDLNVILRGLRKARDLGFSPIKINMLVMKDVNDDEVLDLTAYCLEMGFALRFIETMPIGSSGQDACKSFLSLSHVRETLSQQFDLTPSVMSGGGPAQYFRIDDTNMHVGFITPLSQHFCETCNRVRLSADGTLHLCLGNSVNFELRDHLRSGISDSDLKALLIEAMALKPKQHDFQHDTARIQRSMSVTGG